MTVAELVQVLRETALLTPSEAVQEKDVDALLQRLMKQGTLTPFQVEELRAGRGKGLVLGPYLLLDRLGAGGMGEVYRARQRLLGRVEALKLIKEDVLRHESARQRFQREMQAVAALDHPNIVRATSAGQEGDRHFLAMELIDGIDLARRIVEQGPMSIGEACDCIRRTAQGLQHAHEHGMVHRDIKPSNLMRTRDGEIKILDFGLARLAAGSTDLTGAGAVLGTPDYMAPEQLEGSSAIDIRTDLYSLGCSLYYLLSGSVPFPATSLRQAYAGRVQGRMRPLAEFRGDVPSELNVLLGRMTASDPRERPTTPAEVIAALMPFLDKKNTFVAPASRPSPATPSTIGATTSVQPVSPRSRKPLLVSALVVAGSLLAMIAFMLMGRGDDDPKPVPERPSGLAGLSREDIPYAERFDDLPEEVVAVVGTRRERHWGAVNAVLFSRDGSQVYSGGDDGLIRVWDSGTAEEVAVFRRHSMPIRHLAFAAGDRLVSAGEDGVRVWDVGTRQPIRLLGGKQTPVSIGTLDPKGEVFCTAAEKAPLRMWNVGEGIGLPDLSSAEMSDHIDSLAYSPDGKLLVVAGTRAGRRGSLLIVGRQPPDPIELDSDTPRTLVQFLRDNGHLYVTCGKNRIDHLDIATGKRTRWYAPEEPTEYTTALAWSVAHRLAAIAYGREIHLIDTSTKKRLAILKGHVGDVRSLAFSADGTRLAGGSDDSSVRLWSLPDGKPLTDEGAGMSGPALSVALSPDDALLAVGGLDGVLLRSFGKEGFGPPRVLPGLDVAVDRMTFAADPSRLVVRRLGTEPQLLQSWHVAGEQPIPGVAVPLGPHRPWNIAVSPDGKVLTATSKDRVLFHDRQSGFSLPISYQTSGDPIHALCWSPDGGLLATGTGTTVQLWDVTAHAVKQAGTQGCAGPMAFSPDGKRFVYSPNHEELVVCTVDPFAGSPKIRGHKGPIRFVGYSADGRRIVTAGKDGLVAMWDAEAGTQLWSRRLPGAVHDACFNADRTHLVTANSDGTAYVFRLPTTP